MQRCSTEIKPYMRHAIHLTLQNKQQILFLSKSLFCFLYFKLTLPAGQLKSTPLDSSFSAKVTVSLLPLKSHKEMKTKTTQLLMYPLSPI